MVDYQPEPEVVYHQPAEVQEALKHSWDDFRRAMLAKEFDEETLLEGVEKSYSTSQAAKFFGRSNQWLYWGLREGIFTYKNGDPDPARAGREERAAALHPAADPRDRAVLLPARADPRRRAARHHGQDPAGRVRAQGVLRHRQQLRSPETAPTWGMMGF